jgi:hypothetical protein
LWEGTTSPKILVDPNVGNPTFGTSEAVVLVSPLLLLVGCERTTPCGLVGDGVFWEWLSFDLSKIVVDLERLTDDERLGIPDRFSDRMPRPEI